DPDAHDVLGRSLPSWEPFTETRAALEDARARGWKLAILSNTDRDFIDASTARIGVPFELAIVASEIGSYKPGLRHWEEFAARVSPQTHVHVGASLYHDIAPATSLGLPTVWINRLGEDAEPQPDAELHTLDGLGEATVVEEDSLQAQTLAVASDLPVRPLVLGGCCCSHVGAVEALAARHDRLGLIWLDAHGDLNTPETSPSGNEWGMPLRMLIDGGAVDAQDVALVGARNLD